MSDKSNELPKGLLSFTYHALYDPATNRGARIDLEKEMTRFELSEEAQAAIGDIQTNELPPQESADQLVELLVEEIRSTLEGLWQHSSDQERRFIDSVTKMGCS